MSEEKNKNWKHGLESPSDDFTRKLMFQIKQEDTALGNILNEHTSETPSVDFTANIMKQVAHKPVLKPTPIIGKIGWISIAAAMVGILLLVGFLPSESTYELNLSRVEKMTDNMSGMFENMDLFIYGILGVLAISVFLLIEQFSKRSSSL